MNKENSESAYDFDFNLINDFFLNAKRQGPGSEEATVKALNFIDWITKDTMIADLGCGTGCQTIYLANNTPAQITALDIASESIEKLNNTIAQKNLGNRVKAITGSMDNLPFEKNSLDIIWSEGAIYHIGYEKGLQYWRDYLKPNGYIAVTESTWFTNERPGEINDFWMAGYPQIGTMPVKIEQMLRAGYMPVAAFILPDNCWTDNYYTPLAQTRRDFLAEHTDNPAAKKWVDFSIYEEELYKKYSTYYGYAFYIGKKI